MLATYTLSSLVDIQHGYVGNTLRTCAMTRQAEVTEAIVLVACIAGFLYTGHYWLALLLLPAGLRFSVGMRDGHLGLEPNMVRQKQYTSDKTFDLQFRLVCYAVVIAVVVWILIDGLIAHFMANPMSIFQLLVETRGGSKDSGPAPASQ
jgi:hypothetical protein